MTEAEEFLSGRQSTAPLFTIFDAVGAAAIGPSHTAVGKPCEDFFKLEPGHNWVVAVVSDGAGSAHRAIDGATIVTEEICRTFKNSTVGRNASQHQSSRCVYPLGRDCCLPSH